MIVLEDENFPGMAIIPKREFRRLLRAQEKLDKLEAGGVDNWSGYHEALYGDEEDEE